MNKYAIVFISIIMVLSVYGGIYVNNGTSAHLNNPVVSPATVNPESYYTKEPAPMGIADYGLGPGGNPSSFNSSAFTGIVNITDLKTYNASISSCPNNMGIQLNLIYSFQNGNSTYYYWVQNVALLNTSSQQVVFIDNVWNFTSTNAEMHNSTMHGNGTLMNSSSAHLYYFASDNGTFRSFSYSNIKLRSVSYTASGYPHIYMEYNDGNGWKTYDTLNFTFASSVSHNYGFIVNGQNLLPNNSYADAGLILGGPGNSTNTRVIQANLTMGLEYWNGHNYQVVSNAYNHGSDTAEGVCNVSVSYNSASMIPMAHIETGNTTPGELYNSSNVAVFNFKSTVKNTYIKLNGSRYNFTGQYLNLTLNPGTYNFTLFSKYGQPVYSRNYTLSAGGYYSYTSGPSYNVTFTEKGLAAGTEWGVQVNGNALYSTGNNITFVLYNGTYNYTIPSVAGYSITGGSGNFTVNGADNSINITFVQNPSPVTLYNYIQDYKIIITIVIIGIVALIAIAAIRSEHNKK